MRKDLIWRHLVISARCTWLHGDPRGFRDRHHRVHSSGDYKNPPPQDEHAGLHRYYKDRAGPEVHIPFACRAVIGKAIINFFREQRYPVLLIAVGEIHTHGFVKLPRDYDETKLVAGDAKRKSSRAVKNQMPGSIWAKGGSYEPVRDRGHARNLKPYILEKQGADAWTWSYEDGSDEGMTTRERKLKKERPEAALRSASACAEEQNV